MILSSSKDQPSPVLDKVSLEKLSEVYGQKYQGYQPPPDFGAGNVVYAIEPKTRVRLEGKRFYQYTYPMGV